MICNSDFRVETIISLKVRPRIMSRGFCRKGFLNPHLHSEVAYKNPCPQNQQFTQQSDNPVLPFLGGNFGPEKNIKPPPPSPHGHSPSALSPPTPPPRKPPPFPLFLIETDPPAASSDASSFSPAPEQKKNKKYPKRPPSFFVFLEFLVFLGEFLFFFAL